MGAVKIHALGMLILLFLVISAPIHVESASPGSTGDDASNREFKTGTYPTKAAAPNCAEPPIVKKNLTKEEAQNLLMRITQDPNSVKGELFLSMFLEKHDLPGNVRMTQDTRCFLPLDPNDNAVFVRHCGYHSGLALWEGGFDQTIWRLVDIRWVFPTEKEASAYHKATIQASSERQPKISGAPAVGTDCAVFGGTTNLRGKPLTHYYYIFCVQNVVVKLYVAQGPDVVNPDKRLTPAKVADIARICVQRIEEYNQAAAANTGKHP